MYTESNHTPVQAGVNIIMGFINFEFKVLGQSNGKELDIVDEYQAAQRMWADEQLKDRGFNEVEILSMHEMHEDHENLPVYNEYYKLLDMFNRKVLTATTAVL
jgi:hypothetical protein